MPEIDDESELTPYRQIAVWIEGEIKAGRITRRLPSENQLAQMFGGVAKTTVRRALEYLRGQNVIFTVPNRGSFVRRTTSEADE